MKLKSEKHDAAQFAATQIALELEEHGEMSCDKIAELIRAEYADRDAAVAELEKQARLAATRLMRAYLDAQDLNEAIGALAALEGR